MEKHQSFIAILDFGSQYTHLIARRVRELGVYSEILPHDTPAAQLAGAAGIILSGGPQSVMESALRPDPNIYDLGIPILGLCFGHQLIAYTFGGSLHQSREREYGEATLVLTPAARTSALMQGLDVQETVWMSHGDSVETLPKGFHILAGTEACPVAAMEDPRRRMYSLQFHPEVTHTPHGMHMLKNFVFNICKTEKSWDAEARQRLLEDKVQNEAGDRNVFLLVSGGVDSTVAFALLTKVLGEKRVRGMFVDTGCMRLGEAAQIMHQVAEAGYHNIEMLDATKDFLTALAGVDDPEEKRKRIGKLFLEVATHAREERGYTAPRWVLAQGTIYPDTIESGGTKNADVIKTHHNRVVQAQEMIANKELIEPLSELYKDEVRELGARLGLPQALIHRQPFPGPGLAIRILTQYEKPPQDAEDAIRTDVLGMDATLSAEFRFDVLPIRSVGVQGDQRSYAHPLAISGPLHWDTLRSISRVLLTKHRTVNRAVYCLNSETGILEAGVHVPLAITKAHLDLLRCVDAAVQNFFEHQGYAKDIWQAPVVLIPFGIQNKPSAALRPVVSKEAMTVTPFPLQEEIAQGIVAALQDVPVSGIFYDITDKPPGTIEWE